MIHDWEKVNRKAFVGDNESVASNLKSDCFYDLRRAHYFSVKKQNGTNEESGIILCGNHCKHKPYRQMQRASRQLSSSASALPLPSPFCWKFPMTFCPLSKKAVFAGRCEWNRANLPVSAWLRVGRFFEKMENSNILLDGTARNRYNIANYFGIIYEFLGGGEALVRQSRQVR